MRLPWRVLLGGYVPVFLVLCIPVLAKLAWDIPAEVMLRDGAAVLKAPAYTGIFSNLALIVWGSAATLCLFTAAVQDRERGFWAYAAALTLLLLADDWLMLHDNAVPEYLGMSEYVVYAVYAAAMLAYLVVYRRQILQGEFVLLGLAFAWFALSLAVDALDGFYRIRGLYVLEDGAKLFGIVSWLLFHARLARSFFQRRAA